MKLAIISDIHANLPALEAVWKDIETQQPDNIFCLGDLVNFAGWDNEVIEFIRSHNIATIQGNHDEGIGYNKSFKYSFKTEEQREFGVASIAYVNATISESNRNFLKTLPFSIKIEFQFPSDTIRIALVHGSPFSNNDYMLPETADKDLLALTEVVDAEILFMGHTHKPFHRAIFCKEANHVTYRHVINAGSAGKPKHGDNKSCYVLLTIDEQLKLNDPVSLSVHFQYIEYDVKRTTEHIHKLRLGNAYDDFLLHGEN